MLALSIAFPALSFGGSTSQADFAVLYDLDATAITYCSLGPAFDLVGDIETAGSSTTTTEVADTDPFAPLAAGDIIIASKAESVLVRAVVTKTSASSVVVSSAWDLSADYKAKARKLTCGTTANDGWLDVGNYDTWAILFNIQQVNVTGGIDVQVQCRTGNLNAQPVQVFPTCTTGSCDTVQNYSGAAGLASTTLVVGTQFPFSQCRVGTLIHTADDGADTTTAAERINIGLVRYLSSR